jgi:hypothetical protein
VTSAVQLQKIAWAVIASGGHFHIEDAPVDPFPVTSNIQDFLAESAWKFGEAEPRYVASGQYCMMNKEAGKEYVCYYLSGGTKYVPVAPGSYDVRWWNPRVGGFTQGASGKEPRDGKLELVVPAGGDWVVQILPAT